MTAREKHDALDRSLCLFTLVLVGVFVALCAVRGAA